MAGEAAAEAPLDFSVAVFSSRPYVKEFLAKPLTATFSRVTFLEARLDKDSARLAEGYDAVCLFVNDDACEAVVATLAEVGVRFIAMRCAGYDQVDLAAAKNRGLRVVRVPSYSPRSVAEHALALMMSLARNLRLTQLKVQSGNYTVDGLVGVELSGKTFGVVGTGQIGLAFIKLLQGFGGRVLAYDVYQNPKALELGAQYVDLETLLRQSDVVSLHTPLLKETYHIIDKERLHMMKPHAMLINVSRGGLVDTAAVVEALREDHLGGVALDVYENEGSLFFKDFTELPASERMKTWDARFIEIRSLPQVTLTPHTAFLTDEALGNIATTLVANLKACACGGALENEIRAKGTLD